MPDEPATSETTQALTEQGRGTAERAVLGNNPYGSMIRVIAFVVLFVLVGGTIFYFLLG